MCELVGFSFLIVITWSLTMVYRHTQTYGELYRLLKARKLCEDAWDPGVFKGCGSLLYMPYLNDVEQCYGESELTSKERSLLSESRRAYKLAVGVIGIGVLDTMQVSLAIEKS